MDMKNVVFFSGVFVCCWIYECLTMHSGLIFTHFETYLKTKQRMWLAILENNPKKVQQIVDEAGKGIVNQRILGEERPLHVAARRNRARIAKILIENGADVEARNGANDTALHVAAQILQQASSHLLGRVRNVRDKCLEKFLGSAKARRGLKQKHLLFRQKNEHLVHSGGIRFALDEDKYLEKYLGSAKIEENVMDVLLEHEADVEAKGSMGRTALLLAAMRNNAVGAANLIVHGAEVNAKDDNGWTSLHVVAFENYVELAKILVMAGAVRNVANEKGNTPLHHAVIHGRLEIAEMILTGNDNEESTSFATAENIYGTSPVDYLFRQFLFSESKPNRPMLVLLLKVAGALKPEYGEHALKIFSPVLWKESGHWPHDNFEKFVLSAVWAYNKAHRGLKQKNLLFQQKNEHLVHSGGIRFALHEEHLLAHLENEDVYVFYIILRAFYANKKPYGQLDMAEFDGRVVERKWKFVDAITEKIFSLTYFDYLPLDFVGDIVKATSFGNKIHRLSIAAALLRINTDCDGSILTNYIWKTHFGITN